VKHRKHESAQSQESKGLLATIGGSIGGPRFIEKDDVSPASTLHCHSG
jgi:hypothetical protein